MSSCVYTLRLIRRFKNVKRTSTGGQGGSDVDLKSWMTKLTMLSFGVNISLAWHKQRYSEPKSDDS